MATHFFPPSSLLQSHQRAPFIRTSRRQLISAYLRQTKRKRFERHCFVPITDFFYLERAFHFIACSSIFDIFLSTPESSLISRGLWRPISSCFWRPVVLRTRGKHFPRQVGDPRFGVDQDAHLASASPARIMDASRDESGGRKRQGPLLVSTTVSWEIANFPVPSGIFVRRTHL